MSHWIQEFRMKIKNRFKKIILFGAFVLPGSGHLLFKKNTKLGIHLLIGTTAVALLVIFRWDRFVHTFQSRAFDYWLAAIFIFLSWSAMVFVSTKHTYEFLIDKIKKPKIKTPMILASRRFKENKLAVISLYVICIFYLIAVLAPFLATHDPSAIDNVLETRYQSPSWEHPFGTDEYGRDLYSRALYGARVSLSVGFLAVLIAISIGTLYGSVAGYFGGFLDNLMMRFVDVFIAFPTFFLLLMLVGVFEASIVAMILILGLTSWPGTARFIRGEVLSLKEKQFTEAARAIGLPHRTIILRHLIPNGISPVLVSAAMMVSSMIYSEAGLSFLGIGIRPPTPSWGNMMSAGRDALLVAWWVALFPGGILAATMLSFNLLADGLRDAFDPKVLMRRFL
jgi:peptide/nickel transport system permease protein